MGILSQYQLLQTHTDPQRDLHTLTTSDETRERGEKKKKKNTGNRLAAVRKMTWQLTLVSLIG